MVKKSFSKLGQGSEKLSDNLQSFLITEDDSSANKETSILEITKETIIDENLPAEITPAQKKAEIIAENRGEALQKKAPKVKKQPQKYQQTSKPAVEEIPEDFRSHSVLFSEGQLSDLQEKVLMRKINEDKKYSMKKALYEAFSLWLDQKTIVDLELPDDFKTYTALFSEGQLNSVQDKVYMHKAKEDRGYSLKKALFEAVALYLKS